MLSNVRLIVNKTDLKRDIEVRRKEFKKIIQQNKEVSNLRGYLSQKKYQNGMTSGLYSHGLNSQRIQMPQFDNMQSNFVLPPLIHNVSQLNNTSSSIVAEVFSNQFIRAAEDTMNSQLEKSLNQNSKHMFKRLSPNNSGLMSKKVSEERFSKMPTLNSGNSNSKSLAELRAK